MRIPLSPRDRIISVSFAYNSIYFPKQNGSVGISTICFAIIRVVFADKSSTSKDRVYLNRIEIINQNRVQAHKYDLVCITVVVVHLSYVPRTTTAVHGEGGDSVRIFFNPCIAGETNPSEKIKKNYYNSVKKIASVHTCNIHVCRWY